MTEDEFEQAKARLTDLREDVRADLAEDLGGDSDDFDATRRAVPDGRD